MANADFCECCARLRARFGVCANGTIAQGFETAALSTGHLDRSRCQEVRGWGGRIRTYDTRYQKPMPYHLATPQRRRLDTLTVPALQAQIGEKAGKWPSCRNGGCGRFAWGVRSVGNPMHSKAYRAGFGQPVEFHQRRDQVFHLVKRYHVRPVRGRACRGSGGFR